MAKTKRRKAESHGAVAAPLQPPARWATLAGWRAPTLLAFLVLVFYWAPLTDSGASIQWDAVDVHYSAQKYFADHLHSGTLPHWTPYLFSGFPFLADMQVGAWYPLNWPFFLIGIVPRAIEGEIVLHAVLTALGTFLLFRRMLANRAAAFAGAIAWTFTGYFTDHASHVGMFQTAALLPWLLLCFYEALERNPLRYTALGGLVGGCVILAGHFQNALYTFTALTLFAAAAIIEAPRRWPRVLAVTAGIAVVAAALSAIQTLPGLELTRFSVRSAAQYGRTHDRILTRASLLDAVLPIDAAQIPAASATGGIHAGFYLYGGVLLLPLAVFGLRLRRVRNIALLLIVPPLWYMLGPDAGLYRVIVLLPGFGKVRAPIHMWFVPAFGLALLASAGIAAVAERWPRWWIPFALAALLFSDLIYWNSAVNIRGYARNSFDELYGDKERLAREKLVPLVPPLTRYNQADTLTVFGPLNHPLDLRLETTYGYNPLELSLYSEYRDAMKRNPRLLDGLNVSRYLDIQAGGTRPNPGVLPRAYFAKSIIAAANQTESRARLESLDPALATVVTAPPAGIRPAPPQAAAVISSDGEQAYRIHYRTTAPALLKLSIPYFPGWTASLDNANLSILQTDHALMGVMVPAGEKELLLRFHSTYFAAGAAISALALAAALGLALWPIRPHPTMAA